MIMTRTMFALALAVAGSTGAAGMAATIYLTMPIPSLCLEAPEKARAWQSFIRPPQPVQTDGHPTTKWP
jgi:hypothetical protein